VCVDNKKKFIKSEFLHSKFFFAKALTKGSFDIENIVDSDEWIENIQKKLILLLTNGVNFQEIKCCC
jgi:hypothetical protein